MASPEGWPRSARRRLAHVARQLLPPVVASVAQQVRDRRRPPAAPSWEVLPAWPEADPSIRGWDVEAVADRMLALWPGFVESIEDAAPFGLTNEVAESPWGDIGMHNTILSFGYVLARAARGLEELAMLDWGGGLGRYCLLARALVPELRLDYFCRDVPALVRAGRRVLPEAVFCEDDDTAFGRTYDLVVASGSLQYARDWTGVLAGLARATRGYLYVTRMPLVESVAPFVVVQRPYAHGLATEFAGWVLNRGEFLDEARSLGLELEREFLVTARKEIRGAPEQFVRRGFLFRSQAGKRSP